MRALVLVVIAACGGSSTRENTMLSSNIALDAIGAPHVAVFVTHKGSLNRVWLDTGRTELVTDLRDAAPLDDNTVVANDHGKLVLLRGQRVFEVTGVAVDHNRWMVSPDHKSLAVGEKDGVAVVRVADGQVTRHTMPPSGDDPRLPSLSWADDGALLVGHDRRQYRIDIATGTRTVVENYIDVKSKPKQPGECPAQGVRLEQRTTKGRQEIVLVPLASSANPEQLASIAERSLVAATNHGRGSSRMAEYPTVLELVMVTPTCEHYVFALGERVYVGNVKTGAHAFVLRGTPAVP